MVESFYQGVVRRAPQCYAEGFIQRIAVPNSAGRNVAQQEVGVVGSANRIQQVGMWRSRKWVLLVVPTEFSRSECGAAGSGAIFPHVRHAVRCVF